MHRAHWRRLLLLDPGLRRTFSAGRATLAVAGALALTVPLLRWGEQPPLLSMMALFVALQTSLRPSVALRKQLRSELLAWLSAVAALVLGVLLVPYPLLAAAGFVGVMAVGTWGSGFGPAGLTAGIVGFVSYLFTQFAAPPPERLPWLALSATVGVVAASLVRNLLLPDPPRRIMRWLLFALRARTTALTVPRRRPRARRGGPPQERRRSAEAVDSIVLQLHDLLEENPRLVPDAPQFQRDLFAVVSLTHLLLLQEQDGAKIPHPVLLPPAAHPAERLELYLASLEAARTGQGPPPVDREDIARAQAELERPRESPSPVPAVPRPPAEGWLTGPARRALQVAVAGSLSIVAGMALSPERWYWAALTVFFVFANANSRGAALRKAVERTLGTVGGIAAGLLLGSVLAGHTRLQLLAAFPLLFVGFWLLPVSYAMMTVVVTMLLALMYGILGILTLNLLLLRLGETAIGAAIGVAVAYFLIPARTRGAVDEAFREFYAGMDGLLAALPTASARTSPAELIALEAVRRLDRATVTLSSTINPVSEAVPGRRARALRQELILALTARHWAHRVAARVVFHTDPVDAGALERLVTEVRNRLVALGGGEQSAGDEPGAERGPPRNAMEAAIRRLEAALIELARVRVERDR